MTIDIAWMITTDVMTRRTVLTGAMKTIAVNFSPFLFFFYCTNNATRLGGVRIYLKAGIIRAIYFNLAILASDVRLFR